MCPLVGTGRTRGAIVAKEAGASEEWGPLLVLNTCQRTRWDFFFLGVTRLGHVASYPKKFTQKRDFLIRCIARDPTISPSQLARVLQWTSHMGLAPSPTFDLNRGPDLLSIR